MSKARQETPTGSSTNPRAEEVAEWIEHDRTEPNEHRDADEPSADERAEWIEHDRVEPNEYDDADEPSADERAEWLGNDRVERVEWGGSDYEEASPLGTDEDDGDAASDEDVNFMHDRFDEVFAASMDASFYEAFNMRADNIDTAKDSFVCTAASFFDFFAASARKDGIDTARISQMCVDTILYARDCLDAPDQDLPPELNAIMHPRELNDFHFGHPRELHAFLHTAARFYEAFAASAREIGMDELNTCSMWFDKIRHIEYMLESFP
jgi:hypothetical protein